MDINELVTDVYNNAEERGFYEDINRVLNRLDAPEDRKFVQQIWLSHRLMLIVSELAEGLEAVRDDNYATEPKSRGLGEELGDAAIRLADLINHTYPGKAEEIIQSKALYNRSRPYKHGRSL